MSMTIEVARMRIAREIQEAEASLDEVLIKQSNLLSSIVMARRETASGPFEGHDALLRLNRSQQSILAAGSELARVHSRLQKIQEEKAGWHECPPNKPMGHSRDSEKAA